MQHDVEGGAQTRSGQGGPQHPWEFWGCVATIAHMPWTEDPQRCRFFHWTTLLCRKKLGVLCVQLTRGRTAGRVCLPAPLPRNCTRSHIPCCATLNHCHTHTLLRLRPGMDYICVQSYDGQLSVFESEAFAFSRFLPGFLIPGECACVYVCVCECVWGRGVEGTCR